MHPISPGGTAEQDTGPAEGYPRFHAAVALAQLTSWLPGGRRLLIDISGPGARAAEVAACAGHSVLRVIDPQIAGRAVKQRAGPVRRGRLVHGDRRRDRP